MNKKNFFNEVDKLKGKATSYKVALGSMDDLAGSAREKLDFAETEMPVRLRDWRSAHSAADDFGVEVNFEASVLEEDLDILAMKLEDLGLTPSDVESYRDIMNMIEKMKSIADDAFGELDSGM